MSRARLDGKVAVITGGTLGIGLEVARTFHESGARLVLGSRGSEHGEKALVDLDAGPDAIFRRCDVRERSEVEALVDEAVLHYGRLDILVNNAGGSDGFAPVHDMTDQAWRNALDWNLNAVFNATRRALRHMIAGTDGRVINISSVEGRKATRFAAHYVANKHAINGFTKAVALEYGRQGITCNAVCPGPVETNSMRELGARAATARGISYEEFLECYRARTMTGRLNTVDQVAEMALLLAGPAGAGITGALLDVDGGTLSW
jgi:NAD(P)-dependent dehydrogenase (short-subunit alcohol dehydrogenase family)